jgi:hypothetical protein
MKKLILSVTAIAGLAMAGNAQQVFFHDSNASNPISNDITLNGVISTADVNLELLVGTTAGNVTTDVVTLLLSQTTSTATTALGSVQPAGGDVSAGGVTIDASGNAYKVPAGTDFYQILAWAGNSPTYPGAAGGVAYGETPVLQFDANSTPAAGAPAAEEDLAVPLNLVSVPEPSTLAMAGVGLASMIMFRRRNK